MAGIHAACARVSLDRSVQGKAKSCCYYFVLLPLVVLFSVLLLLILSDTIRDGLFRKAIMHKLEKQDFAVARGGEYDASMDTPMGIVSKIYLILTIISCKGDYPSCGRAKILNMMVGFSGWEKGVSPGILPGMQTAEFSHEKVMSVIHDKGTTMRMSGHVHGHVYGHALGSVGTLSSRRF